MTDPAGNNPKNSLSDFNDELDSMLDKVEPPAVSSNDRKDEEDAIDRLLWAEELNLGESHQADDSEEYDIDDIDLSDEFDDDFEELMRVEKQEEYTPFANIISDDEISSSNEEIPNEIEGFFKLDESDKQELEAPVFETVRSVDQDRQTKALFDNYQDNNFPFADIDATRPAAKNTNLPKEKPETVLSSMSMPDLSEFMSRIRARRPEKDRYEFDNDDMAESGQSDPNQESNSPLQKELRAEFENKTKNTRLFAQVATVLGSTALIAAIGFGLMAHSAKKEVSRLSELVNSLEAATGQGAVGSDKELDDIKAAIEQLNQRVDGIMEQLSSKASPAETKVNESIERVAKKEAEAVQNHLKDLQAQLDVLESKALKSKALAVESAKLPAIKTESVKLAAVNEEIHKPAIVPTKAKRAKLQKNANTTGNWYINLIAYRQRWYAKSKAAEFKQKGIPVDIVDVKVGNETWHRLRVGGFKNRNEAALYAAKVKKTLKLNSVWVGNVRG